MAHETGDLPDKPSQAEGDVGDDELSASDAERKRAEDERAARHGGDSGATEDELPDTTDQAGRPVDNPSGG